MRMKNIRKRKRRKNNRNKKRKQTCMGGNNWRQRKWRMKEKEEE